MKKASIFFISCTLLLVLTSCSITHSNSSTSQQNSNMIIAPSKLSEETQSVLKILDEELAFFDFTVDETVKSSSIDIWTYENDSWVNSGCSRGSIESSGHRIALRLTDDNYDIFDIQENGYSKYSIESIIHFSDSTLTGSSRLTNPTPIELNKEIPLWIKLGTNKNSMRTIVTEDFRTSDCDSGIAVTITFSDKELE